VPHSSRQSFDQRQRMLETPIPPLIWSLAIPTIISMLVTSIYNMADTYFVSQINTSASGAVGIVFSIMTFIQAVGFTVGMGSGSIMSRFLGKEDIEKANIYASSGVLAALTLGVLLSIAGLLCLDPLIWMLGSTETIYPYAHDYAFYILLGAPVMILSFTLNNLLRWQGKASLAVFGLATGGILNMILDPLLIYGFDMGISGAGIATLFSQCISMSILSSFFLLHHSDVQVSPAYISQDIRVYLAILKQGMPSFFRQGVLSVANIALNFNAKLYGDAAVAALAIVGKVYLVVQSIIVGFGQGFQPILGYNYGAKRPDRVKEALFYSIKVCTCILTVAAVIGLLFSTPIVTAFRDDPLVIQIGTRCMRYQCLVLPLGAVQIFANMFFQPLGKAWRATLLAVCRPGLLIPAVFLFARAFGLTGLEISQPLVDLITFLISAAILSHYFRFEFETDGQSE